MLLMVEKIIKFFLFFLFISFSAFSEELIIPNINNNLNSDIDFLKKFSIDIIISQPNININRNLVGNDIYKIGTVYTDKNDFDGDKKVSLGLTTFKFDIINNSEYDSVLFRNSWYSYVKKLDLKIEINNPINIYIDKRLLIDSCNYNVVINHEKKHVSTILKSFDDYKIQLIDRFKSEKLFVLNDNKDLSFNNLKDKINLIIKDEEKKMLNFVNKNNLLLDSDNLYEKDFKICPSVSWNQMLYDRTPFKGIRRYENN